MGAKNAKQVEIERRRSVVADLYVQGWTQAAIASHLNVAQATISTDLQSIRKAWRESAVHDFNELKLLELQKIDRTEREAWAAWERSQKPLQSAEIQDGSIKPNRKRITNKYGDPRFLAIVMQCIARRCSLLGIDAPTRIEPVGGGLNVSYQVAVSHLTVDELRVLKEVKTRLRQFPAPTENGDHPEPAAD